TVWLPVLDFPAPRPLPPVRIICQRSHFCCSTHGGDTPTSPHKAWQTAHSCPETKQPLPGHNACQLWHFDRPYPAQKPTLLHKAWPPARTHLALTRHSPRLITPC